MMSEIIIMREGNMENKGRKVIIKVYILQYEEFALQRQEWWSCIMENEGRRRRDVIKKIRYALWNNDYDRRKNGK